MLYTKEYAAQVNHPVKYSWYDAMTYEYGRYHEDGLGEYNYPFMQKEGDKVPADHFFANFNWTKEKNDYSVTMAQWLGRSQYDVFAGLELQQGGSYKTKVKWDALLDENGKLRLSLGLFAQILSRALVRQAKTIIRMKISSLQVIKEIQLVKNQRTRTGTGLPTS